MTYKQGQFQRGDGIAKRGSRKKKKKKAFIKGGGKERASGQSVVQKNFLQD